MTLPDTSKLPAYKYPKIAERFYRETAEHELTIFQDNGVYRHLRMAPPKTKSSFYWYDVITWPGNLVFRGDGESFAFNRLTDMFEFFRSGIHKDGSLHINASYWAEKLSSNRECVMTYDDEKFSEYVADYLKECEESFPGLMEAWEEATEGFAADYDITHEQGAWEALNNFTFGETYTAKCSCGKESPAEEFQYAAKEWAIRGGHQSNYNTDKPGHKVEIARREPFTFELSDMNFKDYDWWFLWSLYGILKAIKAYDERTGNMQAVDIANAGEVVVIG
jgi:hypothetical protein